MPLPCVKVLGSKVIYDHRVGGCISKGIWDCNPLVNDRFQAHDVMVLIWYSGRGLNINMRGSENACDEPRVLSGLYDSNAVCNSVEELTGEIETANY